MIDTFLYESIREGIEGIYVDSHQSFITINFGGECCQAEIDRIRKEAGNGSAVLYVGIG